MTSAPMENSLPLSKEFVFLDWCPRATNAVDPVVFSLSQETIAAMPSSTTFLVSDSAWSLTLKECHFRNDGMLIFLLSSQPMANTYADPCNSKDWYDNLMAAAAFISNSIKSTIGHTHLYDTDYNRQGRPVRFPSIAKHPVLVNNVSNTDILDDLIRNDDKLSSLKSVNRSGEERRSILLIRERFSKIFDKSFVAISHVKKAEICGVGLYSNYRFFTVCVLAICSVDAAIGLTKGYSWKIVATGVFNFIMFSSVFIILNALHANEVFKRIVNDDEKYKAICSILSGVKSRLSIVAERAAGAYVKNAARWAFVSNYYRTIFLILLLSPLVFASDLFENRNSIHVLTNFFVGEAAFFKSSELIDVFRVDKFLNNLIANIFTVLPVVIVILFTLEVSMKRRKVLQILYRAKGIMQFGSIYNGTVQNIIRHTGSNEHTRGAACLSFDSARSIIEDKIELEKRKRTKMWLYCAMGIIVSSIWKILNPEYTSQLVKITMTLAN